MASVKFTSLTGLAVHPNPKAVLARVYKNTIKVLEKMPEKSAYRKNVQELIDHRLAIINSTEDRNVMEQKIGCGMMEELILQARSELELARFFLVTKPWEPLSTPIPKDQWKWPVK